MRRLLPDRGNLPRAASNSKLKKRTNTQRDGVAIHAVGNRDRIVTHAIGGLQENSRVNRFGSSALRESPEILQPFPVRRRQG
jgi:hypothetical protein